MLTDLGREMDARAKTPEGRYGLGKRIEYRVKQVNRYVVTKWECDIEPEGYGSSGHNNTRVVGGGAEYDSFDTAYAVAYALCRADHEWLGYAPDDERIQYPVSVPPGTTLTLDPAFHSEDEIKEIGSVIATAEGELEPIV